jgi:hypothetical protein
MLPKPQAQRSDRKNKTWDPELRMETLDPDRNWIACFIHDTGFGAAQDRHNSPADPPHTKAYSIINKSLSPAAPTEREQATGYLGFIILRFTDAMLMTMR